MSVLVRGERHNQKSPEQKEEAYVFQSISAPVCRSSQKRIESFLKIPIILVTVSIPNDCYEQGNFSHQGKLNLEIGTSQERTTHTKFQ